MIRLAIVGTGGIAGYHATKFAKIRGCRVVAACDVVADRATAFCSKHAIAQSFTDVGVMLRECPLDAIINATPDRFHAPISLQAIRLKKHVLCEKPLALNYTEAAGMARAAERAGIINMVHFTYRNAPAIHHAHQMIAAGELGHVTHVDASYLQSWLISTEWGDWRKSPGLGWRLSTKHGSMGVLGDLGVHLIDFASYAVGGIASVNARLKNLHKDQRPAARRVHAGCQRHGPHADRIQERRARHAPYHALGGGHLNTVQILICGTKGAIRINLDRSQDKLELSSGDDLRPAKWKESPVRPRQASTSASSSRSGPASTTSPTSAAGRKSKRSSTPALSRTQQAGEWSFSYGAPKRIWRRNKRSFRMRRRIIISC